MIVPSRRFTGAALVLVVAAAVPVWMRQLGSGYDDCARPEQLLDAMRIDGTRRAQELPRRHNAERFQWTQGTLAAPGDGGYPLRFRIIRTFDAASLYSAPAQYFFHYATPGDPTELRWLEADGRRLPVHWRIEQSTTLPQLLQYMFVFGGEPVRNPFPAGLRAALRQLRHGTMPVTLFVTYGANEHSTLEAMQRVADPWLIAAWRHYQEACNP